MKICKGERYRVIGYFFNKKSERVDSLDYGVQDGADVRKIIGTAKWDDDWQMYFTPAGSKGYEIYEA